MVWSRIVFGLRSFHAAAAATRGPLVSRGPFALVRNPIYTSIVLFPVGALVAYPDAWHAAALLVATAGLLLRIQAEEAELLSAYGDEHARYRARVKRLVPYVW